MLKKNLVRYKLIDEHMKAVKKGEYEVGRDLLQLLRKGQIKVGLNDTGFRMECIAEKAGCRISYSRNYNIATIAV